MHIFKHKYLFYLLLVGCTTFFASGCEEDVDPNEQTNNDLQGDWEAGSLNISGVETIPLGFTSFEIEFSKEDPTNGETEWTLITFDGDIIRLDGDYEISNNGMEIEFEGGDFGVNVDFDLDLDGDDLELDGTIDGERWEVELERD